MSVAVVDDLSILDGFVEVGTRWKGVYSGSGHGLTGWLL